MTLTRLIPWGEPSYNLAYELERGAQERRLAREARQRIYRIFKAEHGLSNEEFATEHWQTLFRIAYPEVQS